MRGWVAGWVVVAGLAATGAAQDAVIGQMYHPAGPLPSYEVATIKKADANASGAPLRTEGGWVSRQGGPLRTYILSAYGVSSLSNAQLVGGPAWVNSDRYVIQAKASDEERAAMDKMSDSGRRDENCKMQQALLAERFKLKAHFETREMQVYDLEPAKGGLKVKEVVAPPKLDRNAGPPPPPPPPPSPGSGPPPMQPGMIMMGRSAATSTLRGMALNMGQMTNLLRNTLEVDGKPIADKTGFKGYFDIDMMWANLGASTDTDAPSLFTALEEKLGLKLKAAKGMVEVLVIDSIERPTEN